eukprot:CAMPEP_0119426682 /NCGR_PEP_ID=MMETSP1335-20130426/36819_1 /TAXON_ID=259385 /ORGANISM="Chrysoculter rhomboideus, Strain RCC1486" /LENGTH=134 /DNA_ID=CAMNT_0007452287 /DNA_START=331 /DNA_END=733 /DNA_ORIENTATION=-
MRWELAPAGSSALSAPARRRLRAAATARACTPSVPARPLGEAAAAPARTRTSLASGVGAPPSAGPRLPGRAVEAAAALAPRAGVAALEQAASAACAAAASPAAARAALTVLGDVDVLRRGVIDGQRGDPDNGLQ